LSALPLAATPLWAALLTLVYLALAGLVIRSRYRTRTAIGSGGDLRLERAIRAHANFAEYVPLALILLLLAELQGAAPWLLHLLGATLLAGRTLHAFGISNTVEVLAFRSSGMVLTFAVLVTAAVANLVLLGR
jgi:uncharacterized membrane protein YecN with MAPEG domain